MNRAAIAPALQVGRSPGRRRPSRSVRRRPHLESTGAPPGTTAGGETAQRLLDLQRTFGNAHVSRLLSDDASRPRSAAPQWGGFAQREPNEPLVRTERAAHVPAWLPDVFSNTGAVTSDEAVQIANGISPFRMQRHMRCEEYARNPVEARRPHLGGRSRAHMLDWDNVHRQVRPANPEGAGTVDRQYGSLRRVFYAHRMGQLQESLGVWSVDQALSAIDVANEAGRADVAQAVQAALFRANQYAIVETLNVSTSARYQPGNNKTFCNIYAYDFVSAMGGYLPRVWWTDRAMRRIEAGAEVVTAEEYRRLQAEGESVENVIAPEYGGTVHEMNANALNRWIREYGDDYGWREETNMTSAQEAANSGSIVILLARNANPRRSGHITIILAESTEHPADRNEDGTVRVPLQSQAGATNFNYGTRGEWWSDARHREGAAWIFEGQIQSPIVAPEDLGMEDAPAPP